MVAKMKRISPMRRNTGSRTIGHRTGTGYVVLMKEESCLEVWRRVNVLIPYMDNIGFWNVKGLNLPTKRSDVSWFWNTIN